MSEYFPFEKAKKIVETNSVPITDSWQEYKNACREIIRLNEVIEGMKAENPDVYVYVGPSKVINVPVCGKCGSKWQEVRPGKWQCPECE